MVESIRTRRTFLLELSASASMHPTALLSSESTAHSSDPRASALEQQEEGSPVLARSPRPLSRLLAQCVMLQSPGKETPQQSKSVCRMSQTEICNARLMHNYSYD